MDKTKAMAVFSAVANAGSFSAAARVLGMSAPMVTRSVAQLEELLGVQLFVRTTRHVRLTESGERYLQDVADILQHIQIAEDGLRGLVGVLKGEVRVTAPVLFGQQYVVPVITDFLEQHPQTRVTTLFLDRNVDLLHEGIDVAIRIGQLGDASFRAAEVGEVRTVICVAPAYLERFGRPRNLDALESHQIITSQAAGAVARWQLNVGGKSRTWRFNARLITNTNDAAIAACEQGFGITQVLSYQVADQLAGGNLLELFPRSARRLPINVVHHEAPGSSGRVRAMVDALKSGLGADTRLHP